MPIYEYECESCGKGEEIVQKISDPQLTTCKHCSGKLHKLISQSSFHLKGSGWYVTDYKNSSTTQAKASKNESKESNENENKSSTDQKTDKKEE
ncbi:MAG: zinc ribbon domain-containing protein [Desulfobacterales bacterium]|nr:zinc ribbon domain-containing protein [Desulfobacterales bacterium]